MRNLINYSLLLSVLFLFACSGQSRQLADDFDYGKVENSQYTNDYFDLILDLPANWAVMSETDNKTLMQHEAGRTNASQVGTAVLLTMSQFPLQKAPDSVFNASLVLIAENLKSNKQILSGSDYLKVTRKALDMQPGKRDYINNSLSVVQFGTTDFSEMAVAVTEGDVSYYQNYFTTMRNDFALTFIQTYKEESQKELLDSVLRNIKL